VGEPSSNPNRSYWIVGGALVVLGVTLYFFPRGESEPLPKAESYSKTISESEAVALARRYDSTPSATVASANLTRFTTRGTSGQKRARPAWRIVFDHVRIPTHGPPTNQPLECWTSWGVLVDAHTGKFLVSGSVGPTDPCTTSVR
jgi:hypothetical protein